MKVLVAKGIYWLGTTRDHYRHDLEFLASLFKEAKQDFPELGLKTIQTFRITSSRYNLDFWGIVFPLPAGSEHVAYQPVNSLDFQYTCIDLIDT